MFNYNLAYRFAPTPHESAGFLEGFSGCGFTRKSARENAIMKINLKLDILKQPFEESRVIEKGKLTKQEMFLLRSDWKTSQRSQIV